MAYFEEVWSLVLHAEDRGRQQLSHSVWFSSLFFSFFKIWLKLTDRHVKLQLFAFERFQIYPQQQAAACWLLVQGGTQVVHYSTFSMSFFIFNELGVKNILRVSSCVFCRYWRLFGLGAGVVLLLVLLFQCAVMVLQQGRNILNLFFHSNNQRKPL